MPSPLVVLVSTGFPYINGVIGAINMAGRTGGLLNASTCDPISLARERAVRTLLDADNSHLLLFEQHLVPPEHLLERLLALDADVAVAPYPIWTNGRLCMSVQGCSDRDWPVTLPSAPFRVRLAMPGCVLIKRRVLEQHQPPWFSQGDTGQGSRTEAEFFSEKVRRAGLRFMCDPGVEVGHWRHGIDLLEVRRTQQQEAAS